MANLPTRTTASFFAIQPIPSAAPLDAELDDMKGSAGFLNGGTTAKKLLIKTSDATDPPVDCDQVGAGLLARWKQNTTTQVSIANSGQIVSAISTGTAPISVTSTTTCTNLDADSVDGIQGANIAKLDTHKAYWTASWWIPDPNAFSGTGADSEFVRMRIPKGGVTITKMGAMYQAGTHTTGGSLTYTLNKRTSADSWAAAAQVSGASITLDNTNNIIQQVYTTDFGDAALAETDTLGLQFSAQAGTHTERNITVWVEGYRLLIA